MSKNKGGRPKGSKRPKPAPRRVKKSGYVKFPQEILFNRSLSSLSKIVYGIILTLQWQTGKMNADARAITRILRIDPAKDSHKSVNTALNDLYDAGYVDREQKRGKLGKRHVYWTRELWARSKKGKGKKLIKSKRDPVVEHGGDREAYRKANPGGS